MLRYHHLRLIYNAAPTGRRTRFWNREGEVVCHLCGLHEDSVEHLYFLCRVVLSARNKARIKLLMMPKEASFVDSLLLKVTQASEVLFAIHLIQLHGVEGPEMVGWRSPQPA